MYVVDIYLIIMKFDGIRMVLNFGGDFLELFIIGKCKFVDYFR